MRTLNSLKQMTLFEFRQIMRNKLAFLFSLVMPLVLMAIFGYMYGTFGGDVSAPIGWIDQDRGPVAERLRGALDATGQVDLTVGDEADLKRQLAKGTLRVILILPEDLSKQVAAGSVPAVTILRDPSSTSSNVTATALLNFIGRIGAEMSGARPLLIPKLENLPGMERMGTFDYLMPGQLVYMLLAAGLISIAIGLAHKRQNGSLRHLFTTPLPMGVWLTAQMLTSTLLAVLQILILFTAGWLMFGVHAPYNIPGTIVALIISALTSLSLGLAIGALVKSGDAALPITIMTFFLLALFGNAMMPLDGAPAFILSFQKVLPTYYMTHALRQIMMQGKGLATVAGDLAVLLATIAIAGSLAVWRIRKLMTAA